MKKITISLLLLAGSLTAFCTTWTIKNVGTTFSPATITIMAGDTVNFVLENAHNAREVSEATWNTNGNIPLPGFETPFGGGKVLPAALGVGTHYFVCVPHASFGMKGQIIVLNTSGSVENHAQPNITVYPNPSNGRFQLSLEARQFAGNNSIEIYNAHGASIYQSTLSNSELNIDLNLPEKGIYFIKINNGVAILTKKIVIQ